MYETRVVCSWPIASAILDSLAIPSGGLRPLVLIGDDPYDLPGKVLSDLSSIQ